MAKSKKVEENNKAKVEKPVAKVNKKAVAPAKKAVAPAKKAAAPAKKAVAPAKKVEAPAKKAVTPAKKAAAPAKKAVTPAKKAVAPAKKAEKEINNSVNKVAAKEIKKAIKKAPTKKVEKNPALEAAKIPVSKPVVNKTADQLEQDLKKQASKTTQVNKELPEVVQDKETSSKNESKGKTTKSTSKVEEKVVPKKDNKATSKVSKTTKSDDSVTINPPAVPAPDKHIRYSDEDLLMFETVILEAKREALDELRMLKERLEDLNSYDLAEESMIYSMHMGEQGSEPMEKEKTYAQIQRNNEYIKKLDDALIRIKEKTYGVCRVCGILIAKERLLAVPITTLSASWKIHQMCPEDKVDRIEAI